MLTKDRQAIILSIFVGSRARFYTVPIVEKCVEHAKAVCEPTQGYRPYRPTETAMRTATMHPCDNEKAVLEETDIAAGKVKAKEQARELGFQASQRAGNESCLGGAHARRRPTGK